MDTCIYMAELLCCAPETITTLLIGYTPIENKKFKNIYIKMQCQHKYKKKKSEAKQNRYETECE